MSLDQTIEIKTQSPWRGIHHIALATANLDATIRFYKDVLGMQVSEIAPSKAGRGRHFLVFVKPGDNDVLGLHFFERSVSARKVPASLADDTGETLLHVALRLLDETAANALRQRLHAAQVSITEIPELGTFVFSDNNGILLEATWPRDTATS